MVGINILIIVLILGIIGELILIIRKFYKSNKENSRSDLES